MSYIKREPLLEILNGLYDHHLTMHNYAADGATQDCINAVIEAPTADVVEVVRCKDCKRRQIDAFGRIVCARQGQMIEIKDNDYCSRGRRREG